ncbi:MAG: hypothetical protein ACP5O1_01520 [Phycisphaerae bacterium]
MKRKTIPIRRFAHALCGAVLITATGLSSQAAAGYTHSVPLPPWIQQMEAWPGGTLNPSQSTGPMQKAMTARAIGEMISRMAQSEERLTAAHAGPVTQTIQKKIIQSLNELIAQAEKSQSSSSSSKKKHQQQNSSMAMQQTGQQPGEPTNSPSHANHHSYLPPGEGEHPNTISPFHSSKRQWGNLPPRTRNMILNAMHKASLPQYRSLVNDYYKKLAQMASPSGQ